MRMTKLMTNAHVSKPVCGAPLLKMSGRRVSTTRYQDDQRSQPKTIPNRMKRDLKLIKDGGCFIVSLAYPRILDESLASPGYGHNCW